jgi:hypothetical protein
MSIWSLEEHIPCGIGWCNFSKVNVKRCAIRKIHSARTTTTTTTTLTTTTTTTTTQTTYMAIEPPPIPDANCWRTPRHNATDTDASAALPPRCMISAPIAEQLALSTSNSQSTIKICHRLHSHHLSNRQHTGRNSSFGIVEGRCDIARIQWIVVVYWRYIVGVGVLGLFPNQ